MSLKLMPFESLGSVSYSPSIVTVAAGLSVAVCQIFSIKEWCDLQNRVRGRSRSLKMAISCILSTQLNFIKDNCSPKGALNTGGV